MSKYRNNLPQLNEKFLTDAGLETVLIFHENVELPEFAAFYLLKDAEGTRVLRNYYRSFAELARENKIGLILESATWRANSVWAEKIGLTGEQLADLNRKSIELLTEIRDEYANEISKMVISGCVGPRGDGYVVEDAMTAETAEKYHSEQIKIFSETEADLVSAITMNYAEEAIGVARAAKNAGMPAVISFTVETDGNLPTGQTLKDAIETVDRETENYPAYYMINCAHPTHFEMVLTADEDWTKRIGGLRTNASTKSHAELNESETLDEGNPSELGRQHAPLLEKLENLNVLGGCCGTDIRHVREICMTMLARS